MVEKMDFKKAKAETLCLKYFWEEIKKSRKGICATTNVCFGYI